MCNQLQNYNYRRKGRNKNMLLCAFRMSGNRFFAFSAYICTDVINMPCDKSAT